MLRRSYLLVLVLMLVSMTALAQEEAAEPEPGDPQALIDAVMEGDLRQVRQSLTDGADANTTTDSGLSLVAYLGIHGGADIATALLEAGADPNATNAAGATALMYAALSGNNDVAALLIEKGADVNVADSTGWTALIFAAVGDNAETTTLLLENGADASATDFFGRNAASLAESRSHSAVLEALGQTPAN